MPLSISEFKKKRRGSLDVYGDGSITIHYLTTSYTDDLVLQMNEIRANTDPKESIKLSAAWLMGILDPDEPWDLIDDKDKSKVWPLTEANLRSLGLLVQTAIISAINEDVEKGKEKPSNSKTTSLGSRGRNARRGTR